MKKKSLLLLLSAIGMLTNAQNITVKSPDNNIVVTVINNEELSYSVTFRGQRLKIIGN